MKIMILNGALERRTSSVITSFLKNSIEAKGATATVFNLADADIPFLDATLNEFPHTVRLMANIFREADFHIWLTPLYHGGMTGAMKLSRLAGSQCERAAALSNRQVMGLICWADGGRALLGIQGMKTVAKSLRAWVHPYSVPIVKQGLYHPECGTLTREYEERFEKMVKLLITKS